MTTYYCSNYEEITGKKPGEDEDPVVELAAGDPETKVVWPDSPNVETK
jgi:hypothetical protein